MELHFVVPSKEKGLRGGMVYKKISTHPIVPSLARGHEKHVRGRGGGLHYFSLSLRVRRGESLGKPSGVEKSGFRFYLNEDAGVMESKPEGTEKKWHSFAMCLGKKKKRTKKAIVGHTHVVAPGEKKAKEGVERGRKKGEGVRGFSG